MTNPRGTNTAIAHPAPTVPKHIQKLVKQSISETVQILLYLSKYGTMAATGCLQKNTRITSASSVHRPSVATSNTSGDANDQGSRRTSDASAGDGREKRKEAEADADVVTSEPVVGAARPSISSVVRTTVYPDAHEHVYYQPLLIATTEHIAVLVKSLGAPFLARDASMEGGTSAVDDSSIPVGTLEELLPTMHTFAWLVSHAASSLSPLGSLVQEQLILACQHVIWALYDLLTAIPKMQKLQKKLVTPRKEGFLTRSLQQLQSMTSSASTRSTLQTSAKSNLNQLSVQQQRDFDRAQQLETLLQKNAQRMTQHMKRFVLCLHLFLDRMQHIEALFSLGRGPNAADSGKWEDPLDLRINPMDATTTTQTSTIAHAATKYRLSLLQGSIKSAPKGINAVRRRSSGVQSIAEVFAKAGGLPASSSLLGLRRGTDVSQRSDPPPYSSGGTSPATERLYPILVHARWERPQDGTLNTASAVTGTASHRYVTSDVARQLLSQGASANPPLLPAPYDSIAQKLTVLNTLSMNLEGTEPSGRMQYQITTSPAQMPDAASYLSRYRETLPSVTSPVSVSGWVPLASTTVRDLSRVPWIKTAWKDRYVEIHNDMLMIWKPVKSILRHSPGMLVKGKLSSVFHLAMDAEKVSSTPLGQYASVIGLEVDDRTVLLRFDENAQLQTWLHVLQGKKEGQPQ